MREVHEVIHLPRKKRERERMIKSTPLLSPVLDNPSIVWMQTRAPCVTVRYACPRFAKEGSPELEKLQCSL